jgi:hypothetical protein
VRKSHSLERALGLFDDGLSRDVTSPSFGTTYETEDEGIAVVDASGLVTAVGDGITSIHAVNGSLNTVTTVHASGFATLGDLDGDGVVGHEDFQTLLEAWGPCPAPCPPLCPADLDGDCQVSIVDFLTLLANWTL